MTRHRRAANLIFSKPLTLAELAAKNNEPTIEQAPKGRLIVCSRCGQGGGTLVKIGDNDYKHQTEAECGRGKTEGRREV